jgi:hypothetical protein
MNIFQWLALLCMAIGALIAWGAWLLVWWIA